MKNLKYVIAGVIFAFLLIKAEAISWYRIVEMFRFQSFHMFGIIGTAVFVGATSLFVLKKLKINSLEGVLIEPKAKPDNYKSNFWGGILFGVGWSLAGACTAPLFVMLGRGVFIIIIPVLFAYFGVLIFGLIKHKLPH